METYEFEDLVLLGTLDVDCNTWESTKKKNA